MFAEGLPILVFGRYIGSKGSLALLSEILTEMFCLGGVAQLRLGQLCCGGPAFLGIGQASKSPVCFSAAIQW